MTPGVPPLAPLGEAEPARALGEDTLQRCRRVLGPDHLVTLGAAAALTNALDQVGQVGQAEPARALGESTPRWRPTARRSSPPR